MDKVMTFLTQGNADRKIKEIAQRSSSGKDVFGQFTEQSGVMSVQGASACAAFLACVVISLKHCNAPFFVLTNFSKVFLPWSDATLPFVMLWTALFLIAFQQCGQILRSSREVTVEELGNAVYGMMVPCSYWDYSSTATLAFMFSSMFFNPLVYAAIICAVVISWVFGQAPTLDKGSVFVSRDFEFHGISKYLRFNGKSQEKLGELLETLTGSAEGNQQPSAENWLKFVSAKVQRLVGEDTNPIISHKRPTADAQPMI